VEERSAGEDAVEIRIAALPLEVAREVAVEIRVVTLLLVVSREEVREDGVDERVVALLVVVGRAKTMRIPSRKKTSRTSSRSIERRCRTRKKINSTNGGISRG